MNMVEVILKLGINLLTTQTPILHRGPLLMDKTFLIMLPMNLGVLNWMELLQDIGIHGFLVTLSLVIQDPGLLTQTT